MASQSHSEDPIQVKRQARIGNLTDAVGALQCALRLTRELDEDRTGQKLAALLTSVDALRGMLIDEMLRKLPKG